MISMWFSGRVWNWIGTKSFYVWNKCILKISQRISFCCYLTSIFFLVSYKLYATAQLSKLLCMQSKLLWMQSKLLVVYRQEITKFMNKWHKKCDYQWINNLWIYHHGNWNVEEIQISWLKIFELFAVAAPTMSHTYETNSPHIYLCLRIGLIALIDVQMDLFLQTNWYSV